MPKYNSEQFDPPAPLAYVTLRNLEIGTILPNVPMLIDTEYVRIISARKATKKERRTYQKRCLK